MNLTSATTAKSATASRWAGLGVVLALHAAVIAALLQHQPVRDALAAAAPIMVSLISPPKVVVAPPPKPQIDPPKPKSQPVRKPLEPPPLIAAPVEAPSPIVAPAPPPEPPKEAEPPPPPAPVVAPAPPPITPPNFTADYLDNPAPAYPAISRRMREQGKVILRVLVSAEGRPEKVELRTSSGSARLDGSALEAVRHWKFVPARQGDRPVPAWVLVPISFTLQG